MLAIHVVVHGDGFTARGVDSALDLCETALATSFDLKLRGRLGEGPDDIKEIRVLNRILRVVPEGLRSEADPLHCELLVRSMGMQDYKFISTPSTRWDHDLENGPVENEHVDEPDDAHSPEDPVPMINEH